MTSEAALLFNELFCHSADKVRRVWGTGRTEPSRSCREQRRSCWSASKKAEGGLKSSFCFHCKNSKISSRIYLHLLVGQVPDSFPTMVSALKPATACGEVVVAGTLLVLAVM